MQMIRDRSAASFARPWTRARFDSNGTRTKRVRLSSLSLSLRTLREMPVTCVHMPSNILDTRPRDTSMVLQDPTRFPQDPAILP